MNKRKPIHTLLALLLALVMLLPYLPQPAQAAPKRNESVNPDDLLYLGFLSGASDRDGKKVWTPSNTNADHQFAYVVDYLVPGITDVAPGDFEIRLPLHILRDRDGNYADYFDAGILSEEELAEYEAMLAEFEEEDDEDYEDPNTLVFRIEGDEVVIYNRLPLPGAESGSIEIGYHTSKKTPDYVDMAASEAPWAVYKIGGQTLAEAESVPVYIDTTVRISYVQKLYPDRYNS